MNNDDESKSLDLLGLKPLSEAAKIATQGVVNVAETLFEKIVSPPAEEFGLALRDRVIHWRNRGRQNLEALDQKFERKRRAIPGFQNLRGHPRIVGKVIEESYWEDADEVQEMWAGLLTSACTPEGDDDSNLAYINLLSQLTKLQVLMFSFACENCSKQATWYGGVTVEPDFRVTVDQIKEITGVDDLVRIDRELDALRTLGLLNLHAGFSSDTRFKPRPNERDSADLSPSDLGIQMYVRCQGSRVTAAEYFALPKPESS